MMYTHQRVAGVIIVRVSPPRGVCNEDMRHRLRAGVTSALALSTQAADLADQLQLKLPLLNAGGCLERFAGALGIPQVGVCATDPRQAHAPGYRRSDVPA